MFFRIGFAFLPKSLLSFMTGWLSRTRFPPPMSHWVNSLFVFLVGIDMSEAEFGTKEYATIEEVFCRRLRPGARKARGPFCAPADGRLTIAARADQGTALQVKGLPYSLAELVGAAGHSEGDLAYYLTIYLAPHNYHRVHSPLAGRLVEMRHISGELWPVNGPAVRSVPRLFARNERLVFVVDLSSPQVEGGRAYICMIGALNVGRISASAPLPNLTTHLRPRLPGIHGLGSMATLPCTHTLTPGAEIGTFMLGSTVVVVLDRQAALGLRPEEVTTPRVIRVGDPLFPDRLT